MEDLEEAIQVSRHAVKLAPKDHPDLSVGLNNLGSVMPVSVILPQFFLPKSSVKLGRFVTNVDEPHQYYYDPSPRSNFSVFKKVETNYDSIDTLAPNHNFVSELTSFLSSSISNSTKTSIHITTKQVKTYYLDNNGQWFRDAVCSEDTRKWIERIIAEGEDIYVVVGYHTVPDARIAGQQRQFVAQGEQIIAVQYRKVRFRLFSSKSVHKATLGKETRWERYTRYLQSDGEDMVEVELEYYLPLEGVRAKCTVGSGEILFSTRNLNA